MRNRKVYGQSRIEDCPFCSRRAVTKTEEDVPCCEVHRKAKMPNLKCACGKYLMLMSGKFGSYFNCIDCGNHNFRKGLEMNNLESGKVPSY